MIETARLKLVPLLPAQLCQYLKADGSLEAGLGLRQPVGEPISEDLVEALEQFIIPASSDPDRDYRYYTLWTLILKSEQVAVGDICFKGEPDAEGQIEIGYGTYGRYQHQGYMTEAVGAMVEWAAAQPKVRVILAETLRDNLPSQRILERNGFTRQKETETSIWWSYRIR